MRTEFTYEHLAAVRAFLPELDRAIVPSSGRRRHWNERDLSPERRAAMDAQALAEREAKERSLALGLKPSGASPAPLDLSVFDARAHIVLAVVELEEAVCDKLDLTPAPGSTADTITRLISLLDRIALHDDLADHVHNESTRLRQTARIVLGEQEPVVRLTGRCPNCRSLSLRAYPERFTVACVDTTCRCDDEDCPCQREESWRHVWPYERWPWLAAVLREGIGVAP
ncbi:unnamed protein product [[Actinomadura] parvosata subsp. kistnae]|uniref:Uncharacterized protein n=1 Tax=[Actinomadura] parvosata subsp. kistnae TaxID=1909395 RepID=A0A1V0ABR3_9ACTN|nr:hypothetical protein [Nonomuraea sp. ATCC 55076]AQZ67623.1 hypothetical protein BKM31_44695 [Nonomuraea sp. ATCC 55076]SPL94093.1 unnamed protein product [Actinomadura parvosata subsp. kistnae]